MNTTIKSKISTKKPLDSRRYEIPATKKTKKNRCKDYLECTFVLLLVTGIGFWSVSSCLKFDADGSNNGTGRICSCCCSNGKEGIDSTNTYASTSTSDITGTDNAANTFLRKNSRDSKQNTLNTDRMDAKNKDSANSAGTSTHGDGDNASCTSDETSTEYKLTTDRPILRCIHRCCVRNFGLYCSIYCAYTCLLSSIDALLLHACGAPEFDPCASGDILKEKPKNYEMMCCSCCCDAKLCQKCCYPFHQKMPCFSIFSFVNRKSLISTYAQVLDVQHMDRNSDGGDDRNFDPSRSPISERLRTISGLPDQQHAVIGYSPIPNNYDIGTNIERAINTASPNPSTATSNRPYDTSQGNHFGALTDEFQTLPLEHRKIITQWMIYGVPASEHTLARGTAVEIILSADFPVKRAKHEIQAFKASMEDLCVDNDENRCRSEYRANQRSFESNPFPLRQIQSRRYWQQQATEYKVSLLKDVLAFFITSEPLYDVLNPGKTEEEAKTKRMIKMLLTGGKSEELTCEACCATY